jgi:hypothetical protein
MIELLAIFTALCLVLGLAGWAIEAHSKPDVLPPPDPACERDGSITSFYRRNGVM